MNDLSNKKLFIHNTAFTLFIIVVTVVLYYLSPQIIYSKTWALIAFFFLLTQLSVWIVQRATRKNPQNFMAVYFSAMIARLFISILLATVFILTDKQHIMVFAGNFIVLYLSYLGFEIYTILTNLRHHFRTGSGDKN